MSPGSWMEELEARLNQQLESFLRANPQQEALLEEQAQRDRQQRLLHERLKLRQEAELQRQGLLRLAGEIRQWQERSERARGAGAEELAARAEAHIAALMEQGRNRWQTLAELGERFAAVERELAELNAAPTQPAPGRSGELVADGMAELEQDWRRFEAQQELEALRRRNQS